MFHKLSSGERIITFIANKQIALDCFLPLSRLRGMGHVQNKVQKMSTVQAKVKKKTGYQRQP